MLPFISNGFSRARGSEGEGPNYASGELLQEYIKASEDSSLSNVQNPDSPLQNHQPFITIHNTTIPNPAELVESFVSIHQTYCHWPASYIMCLSTYTLFACGCRGDHDIVYCPLGLARSVLSGLCKDINHGWFVFRNPWRRCRSNDPNAQTGTQQLVVPLMSLRSESVIGQGRMRSWQNRED